MSKRLIWPAVTAWRYSEIRSICQFSRKPLDGSPTCQACRMDSLRLFESTSRSLAKSGRLLGFVVRRRRLDVGVSIVGSNGHLRCGFDRSVQALAGGIECVVDAGLLLEG